MNLTAKQSFIQFLASGVGVVATAALFAGIGLCAFYLLFSRLRRIERSDELKGSSRRARRRRESASAPDPATGTDLGRAIATILAVACLLLPLVFTIALDDVFAQPKTALLWGFALVLGAMLALAVASGARPRRLGVLEVALLAYVVLYTLATILSVDPGHSLGGESLQYQGLLSALAYVVLLVGARSSIVTVPRVQGLAMGLLVAATIAATYAIAQGLGVDPIWSALFKDRVFSTVGQANALASILGMAGLLSLALIAGYSRRNQALVLAAVVIVASALVLTFSRGGYMGVLIGLAVAGIVLLPGRSWSTARSRLSRVALPIVGAVLVVGALAIVWPPVNGFAGRVAQRVLSIPAVSESSNRSHLDLWEVGIRMAAEHPLFGTGPDTYILIFPDYRDRVLTPDRAAIMARFRPESAHNVYISTAAGAGIPALIAYLVIIGAALAAGIRAARRPLPAAARLALAGLMGAVAVHLVTDAFMTAEPSSSAIFWVLLGSIAGLAPRLSPPAESESAVTARQA
jgi:putative inorganic carbon (HCO3(-)) transporter